MAKPTDVFGSFDILIHTSVFCYDSARLHGVAENGLDDFVVSC